MKPLLRTIRLTVQTAIALGAIVTSGSACSSDDASEPAAEPGADAASVECPRVATTCPEGCYDSVATPLPDGVCGAPGERETVGCSESGASTRDVVCRRRRSDGAVYTGSSSSMPPDLWESCDEERGACN